MSDSHRPPGGESGAETRLEAAALQARLLSNAGKLFSSTTAASLIGVGSFILTARSLGSSEFGKLVLVFTFANAVVRLCGFQSWQAIIKYAAEHRADGREDRVAAVFRFGFLLDLGASALAAVLVFAGAAGAAVVFDWRPEVEDAARWYAVAVLFGVTGAPTAALRLHNRFGLIAWQQTLAALFKLALVVLVLVMVRAPTFEAFVLVWMVSYVATHVLLMAFAAAALHQQGLSSGVLAGPTRIRDVISRKEWRFVVMTNLDGMVRVVRELDSQVVALLIDEAAAGLLRVARQLATFVGRLVDAFFEAIYPDLARIASAGRWKLFATLVRRSSLQVGGFAALALIGFALVGRPFVSKFFGASFEGAYPATCVLIGAMVVWGFAQPFAPALLALGAVGRMLINHIVASAAYLALLFALTPKLSYIGAAWAMVGLYVVWSAMTFRTYRACVPRTAND